MRVSISFVRLIAAAARALELDEVAQLAERWMQAASRLEGTVPGASAVDAFTRAHSALECMLDAMAADQAVDPVDVELASALAKRLGLLLLFRSLLTV
mgnify:CR=1 FL=1